MPQIMDMEVLNARLPAGRAERVMHIEDPLAITVPVEVFCDARLSSRDLRILGLLYHPELPSD